MRVLVSQCVFVTRHYNGDPGNKDGPRTKHHHEPPTTNYQPPTTNYQPPTTNHQPPTDCYTVMIAVTVVLYATSS